MNVYEDNIKFLNKNYPDLLTVIHDNRNANVLEYCEARSGEPNVVVPGEEVTNYLHSRYNPLEEAKKWVNSLGEQIHSEHVLIIGCGLGYYLEQLVNQSTAAFIYVYEPDPRIFKAWMKTRDARIVLANHRIRVFAMGENELLQTRLAMRISECAKNKLTIVYPPIYSRLFPSLVGGMHRSIKEMLYAQAINQITLSAFQEEWITNILYNLPYVVINTSASRIKEMDKGMTAIVVGSGPSLEQDIHYLRQLKDTCFIIAAGSSIQALQHAGISPHLVVSIDGGIPNFRVFQKVNTEQYPLLFCPLINFNIIDNYKGQMLVANLSNDSITSNLCKKWDLPVFRSSSSVTGTALQIAAYMGASEIILMGQDLSYPNKQFYSPGINHVEEIDISAHLKDATELVPNVVGGQNPTTLKMKTTLEDIELQIKLVSLGDVRIINTSGQGAVISGTEWIPMGKLIHEISNRSFHNYDINSYIVKLTNKEKIINLMDLKTDYISLQKEVGNVEKKIAHLMTWIAKLEGKLLRGDVSTLSKYLIEIDKLWNQVTKKEAFEVLYSFALKHHINDYMKFVSEIVETNDLRRKSRLIVKHLGLLIKEMNQFTPEIIRILKNAMDRLENMISELGDTNNGRAV